MFWVVSRNSVAARHPFQKRVSVVHKSTSFCYQNHFFVFRNEHAQSTTLGTKLMFGVCWGPSASEGPQKQDLTVFLEYNV
jgi:hypothetical protein